VDEPLVKPLIGIMDIRKFSQHFVDLLNLEKNRIETISLTELLEKEVPKNLDLIGIRDMDAARKMRDLGRPEKDFWILTFDPFLTETPFLDIMKRMLRRLQNTYHHPVDIEFTVNFNQQGNMQINLLQCRPFQSIDFQDDQVVPENIHKNKTIIRVDNNFMGGNVSHMISRIILVDPEPYVALSMSEKYSIARLIGKLNKLSADREKMPTLLMGPGRWGTQTPAMGVPVHFSEINQVAAIGEISYQNGSLIPDLSFGTHFFHDLIESRIFYIAVYPENPDVIFNLKWIRSLPNLLGSLIPASRRFENVVKVVDTSRAGLKIQSDVGNQTVICYLSEPDPEMVSS